MRVNNMQEIKLNGESMNIVEDNIEKLKTIFPDVFTEDKIDFEKLQSVLGDYIEKEDERYNLTWNGKQKALRIAQTPSTGTLRPCKDDSKNWDTTENLYIEGDNLEVLKLLQKSYHNKIKMIYIDPPYNTGNDFVYADDFKDDLENYKKITGQIDEEGNKISSNSESDGRYHTNWLNMMYPRLRLARNLLSDDGVIFISIDDREIDNLKKLGNEIFGDENFVGIFSVENNPKGRKNSKFISVSNDYCLVFAKNKNNSYFVENIPKNANDLELDEDGNYVHNSGKRVLVGENDFNNVITNYNSEKHYSVYYNKITEDIIIKSEMDVNNSDNNLLNAGYVRYISTNNKMQFVENTYTKTKFQELFDEKALDFKESKIFGKNYSTTIRVKSMLVNNQYKAIINNNEIDYKLDYKTTSAGTYLKTLFDTTKPVFQAPKSVGLLQLFFT